MADEPQEKPPLAARIEQNFDATPTDSPSQPCPNAGAVGEPGFWEGAIPVWGSGRAAVNDFQTGHWGWGLVNTALAVSDVFLVKALVVGAGKLLVKGAAKAVVKEGAEQAEKAAVRAGLAYENPSKLVQSRVEELRTAIPENSRGRITMGTAVVEDAGGGRSVLISTSEPRGYLRPGVTLKPGETMVVGTGHAEADIVAHAQANNLKVIDIGATRPVCGNCQSVIGPTGANVSTPLKK